ncbi:MULTISPECIES: ABC transporter ATP-binding protein [unclassified Frigoribacterium]|uniref:ABC transporter ATP-binding protein n=2 Tax=Frigoribacterium TaxID=96492 RepID=UPI001FCEF75E|nr:MULTISPECIES: ATP-binding cassette domain-containing protein [unclassified Frigoribacterium]
MARSPPRPLSRNIRMSRCECSLRHMTQVDQLRLADVEIRYGRRLVVVAPSLEVTRSSTTALVGASGSGKSSLLRCLSGLQRPSSGRVLVDDLDLTSLSPSRLARRRRDLFGIVLQDGGLVPSLSALDNVQVALDLRRIPRSRATARSTLDHLGLARLADRRPDQLSGGERQRVAFARVLAQAAPFAVLDEPTSSLDADSRADVVDGIRALSAAGCGTVVVTHDLELAASFDAVAAITRGHVTTRPGPTTAAEISHRIDGVR